MVKSLTLPSDPYYQNLHRLLTAKQDDHQLFETIVNAPFHDKLRAIQLDLGIVVLLLVNATAKTIDRIALSNTYSALGAVRMSAKPFKQIKIPIDYHVNLIAKAIATGKSQSTSDWQYLFVPDLSAEDAHFNQAGAGIDCSVVYPLLDKRKGALIFSLYQPLSKIDQKHHNFMSFYASLASSQL